MATDAIDIFTSIVTPLFEGENDETIQQKMDEYAAWRESPESQKISMEVLSATTNDILQYYAIKTINYHILRGHDEIIPPFLQFIIGALWYNQAQIGERSLSIALESFANIVFLDNELLNAIPFDSEISVNYIPIFFEKFAAAYSTLFSSTRFADSMLPQKKLETIPFMINIFPKIPPPFYIHFLNSLLSIIPYEIYYDTPDYLQEFFPFFIQLLSNIPSLEDQILAIDTFEKLINILKNAEKDDEFSAAVFTFGLSLLETIPIEEDYVDPIKRIWDSFFFDEFSLVDINEELLAAIFEHFQNTKDLFMQSSPNSMLDMLPRITSILILMQPSQLIESFSIFILDILIEFNGNAIPGIIQTLASNLFQLFGGPRFYEILSEKSQDPTISAKVLSIVASTKLDSIPIEALGHYIETSMNGDYYEESSKSCFLFFRRFLTYCLTNENIKSILVTNATNIFEFLIQLAPSFPDYFLQLVRLYFRAIPESIPEKLPQCIEFANSLLDDCDQSEAHKNAVIFLFFALSYYTDEQKTELFQHIQSIFEAIEVENYNFIVDILHDSYLQELDPSNLSIINTMILQRFEDLFMTDDSEINDIENQEETILPQCAAMQIATPMIKYMTFEQINIVVERIVEHFGQSSVVEHISFFMELLNNNSWVPDNADVCQAIAQTVEMLSQYQSHPLWVDSPIIEVSNIISIAPNIGEFESIQSYAMNCFGSQSMDKVSQIVSIMKTYYSFIYVIQNTNILEYLNQIDLSGEGELTNTLVELFYSLPNSLFTNFPFTKETFPSQFIVNLFCSPIITRDFDHLIHMCRKSILFGLFHESLYEALGASIIQSLFGYLPQDDTKSAFLFLSFLHKRFPLQVLAQNIINENSPPPDIASFLNSVFLHLTQLSEEAFDEFISQEDSQYPLQLEAFHLWRQCRP